MTKKEKLANTIEILNAAKRSRFQREITPSANAQLNKELKDTAAELAHINRQEEEEEEAAKAPEEIYVIGFCDENEKHFIAYEYPLLNKAKALSAANILDRKHLRRNYYVQEYVLPKKQNTEDLKKLESDLAAMFCRCGCWFEDSGSYCRHYMMQAHADTVAEFKSFVRRVKEYVDSVKEK